MGARGSGIRLVFLIFVGLFENGDPLASSITVTIMMLAVLPAVGVAQAVMVLVGQHLGSKRPDLAEEASWSGVRSPQCTS